MVEASYSHTGERYAGLDVALAAETIGRDIPVDPFVSPDTYNEAWAIVERTLNIRTDLFNATVEAANALNIPVDAAAWPDDAASNMMHRVLSRERKKLGMLEGIDNYVAEQDSHEAIAGTKLRPNQTDAMHKLQEFLHDVPPAEWQKTGKAGYIDSATGTGKTGIFSKLTAILKHDEDPEEPVRVLIVTPRQKILDQTHKAFKKFAPNIVPGRYFEDVKDFRDVTVISQASFDALMAKGELPDFDAVIVDEAHMVGAQTDAHLRAYCADKILLGVTATPNARTRNLFGHEVHKYDLRDAIQDGVLAPVRAHEVVAEPDWSQHKLPADPTERKRAMRALRQEEWKVDAIGKIRDAVARGVGVVVRCPAGEDIEFARMYAEALRDTWVNVPPRKGDANKLGLASIPHLIRAVAIGGKEQVVGGQILRGTKLKAFQAEALKHFEQADADVLTYVSALGVGWDSLQAKVFIDMDPARSSTEILQALGRILRLLEDEDGNPVWAEAYTYRDPDMEDQFTVCDALNVRSGESVEHIPFEERPASTRPAARKAAEDEDAPDDGGTFLFIGATGTSIVVQTVEIAHNPGDEAPENESTYEGEEAILTCEDAARRLKISPRVFAEFWAASGMAADDLILASELPGFIASREDFQAEPLPDAGYIAGEAALGLYNKPRLKLPGFRQIAALNGVHVRRFLLPSGEVGLFFDEAEVTTFIQNRTRRTVY